MSPCLRTRLAEGQGGRFSPASPTGGSLSGMLYDALADPTVFLMHPEFPRRQ